MKRVLVITVLAAAVMCLAGCGAETSTTPDEFEYRREYRRGPLAVTLLADRTSISLADELLFRLETALDEGYRLQPIRFGDNLQGFGIREYRTEPARLDAEGRALEARWYRLEPFVTGELAIPEIGIRFVAGPSGESPGTEHELVTEPVAVAVTSLLDEDRENLALKPPRSVVEIPVDPSFLVFWTVIAAVIVAVIAWYLVRRFKRRAQAAVYIPAHVKALARLRRLGEEKLLESGEIKTFFYLLSEILRCYVEDRFGLRAPEQTSEEFLRDLASSDALSGENKQLLRAFFDRTDPVKYARLIPDAEEIQAVFDMARKFILDTKNEAQDAAAAGKGATAHAVR